ncbi:hypothetical protein [Pleomorphomonas sp. PLEO]|uniref:hypothetical protein n=1 Tax=Pleomorphomonas sp. PLEO TaxID=3239306 RepID=UPI00351DF8B3
MSAITILSGPAIEQAISSPAGFPTVEVVEPVWREAGGENNPRCVLKGIWTINGLSLHVVALECRLIRPASHDSETQEDEVLSWDEFGGIVDLSPDVEGYDIGWLWTAHGMEGNAETAIIDGRHYLIFASPFCT